MNILVNSRCIFTRYLSPSKRYSSTKVPLTKTSLDGKVPLTKTSLDGKVPVNIANDGDSRQGTLTKNESKPKLKNAEEAVNDILLNMTLQDNKPFLTKHVIDCMVINELGVLSRVSGVLSGMGVNISSLVVAQTEVNDLSRITITINGQDEKINRARKQLEELVHVWAVLNHTKTSTLGSGQGTLNADRISGQGTIYREMLLIKVSKTDLVEPINSLSKCQSLTELVKFFNAKVVDTSHDCMIIELTAKSDKIDAFMELIRPFGILETIRSGVVAMSRSYIKAEMQIPLEEKEETVDATLLPPG